MLAYTPIKQNVINERDEREKYQLKIEYFHPFIRLTWIVKKLSKILFEKKNIKHQLCTLMLRSQPINFETNIKKFFFLLQQKKSTTDAYRRFIIVFFPLTFFAIKFFSFTLSSYYAISVPFPFVFCLVSICDLLVCALKNKKEE